MRTVLLSVLFFAGLATASEQGLWGIKDPATGRYTARLIAIEKDSDFVFNYFTDERFRCEVPGIAKPLHNSGGGTFIFKNSKEYWWLQGYEGYSSSEATSNCRIEFNFTGKAVEIKEIGNCRSFCGAGGSLDAILDRVSY